ncbi:MAG: chloride channel protein [Alphaproteobacteria bacterium]
MALGAKTARYRRLARLLWHRWRRRVVFLLGGTVTALVAIAFTVLADYAHTANHLIRNAWPYAPLILCPAGFGLIVFLANRYFPNSQGSGIPQVIAARHLDDPAARVKLVGLRVAIGKIFLTLAGLVCGASIGREGPTVQIGAAVMFAVGRMTPRRQRGLIVAGAGAGVAAAFNAPLAGIIFAIEELSRSFDPKTSRLVIAAVLVAGLISAVILGNYSYFGKSQATLHGIDAWIVVPVCGVLGGVAGGLFSRLLVVIIRGFHGRVGQWCKRNPVFFAVLCGLAFAIIGVLSHGSVYGTGYDQARALLEGDEGVTWSFGLLKFGATLLSSISGLPGGLFSPSLAVGAGFGMNIAALFSPELFKAVVLVGMVAYFTGVVQAPITAFVIVTEMTQNYGMLVPLMGAALIAHVCSRMVCPKSVYHALAENYLAPPPR